MTRYDSFVYMVTVETTDEEGYIVLGLYGNSQRANKAVQKYWNDNYKGCRLAHKSSDMIVVADTTAIVTIKATRWEVK